MNILKQIFCSHKLREDITLQDRTWDRMMDNDDLEDRPTPIRVEYCTRCGKILGLRFESHLAHEAPMCDINKFEKITGIDHRTITLYRDPVKLLNFRDIWNVRRSLPNGT